MHARCLVVFSSRPLRLPYNSSAQASEIFNHFPSSLPSLNFSLQGSVIRSKLHTDDRTSKFDMASHGGFSTHKSSVVDQLKRLRKQGRFQMSNANALKAFIAKDYVNTSKFRTDDRDDWDIDFDDLEDDLAPRKSRTAPRHRPLKISSQEKFIERTKASGIKELQRLEQEVLVTAIRYSRLLRPTLAKDMLDKLPRELRDIIYNHVSDNTAHNVDNLRNGPPAAWYYDPAIIDPTIAREMLELHYRRQKFHFDNDIELAEFLARIDRDVKVADFVNCISVAIPRRDYTQAASRKELRTNLQALQKLANKSARITIALQSRKWDITTESWVHEDVEMPRVPLSQARYITLARFPRRSTLHHSQTRSKYIDMPQSQVFAGFGPASSADHLRRLLHYIS